MEYLPLLESIIEFTGIALAAVFLIVVIAFVWKEVVEAFVSNSDTFIRRGRRLQNRLHLPPRLRLFADSDPGMPEDTIRSIVGAALPVGLMLLTILGWGIFLVAKQQEPDKWFWYLVGLFVGCLVFPWVLMLVARSQEARRERAAADGGEGGYASPPRVTDGR
ncbi:hypothetical protein CcaCcLH18_06083 [Colletotrichum camelliae]|nr:hypothetical protein CcaCcLH18_06083 [Colletotrichum camelliae]